MFISDGDHQLTPLKTSDNLLFETGCTDLNLTVSDLDVMCQG
jgi:hypothetical protein